MISQVVGKSVRIQLEVILHGLDIELTPVLGMGDPVAAEDNRFVLTHKQQARELDILAGGGCQSAR
ncbi:hypothetical protein DSCOOX_30280 [Desulfosarcina ovata subsp. ovata]|uniref:Uncharacterized protein n=1 Tax=Desulfosarcina ovata subsp. ovata TaxID=2752305 RepID=A0A5K8ABJ1_9BACT|nr:hypothetical protein DSCOOX_30280 [Desulfosarcina ovata subsp. ovata]